MKIILANYRYYISGGPEMYLFNVKKLLENADHTVIPFSVRSPLNEKTSSSSDYFPHGKSESGDAYFDNVKKTPSNIMRLLSCAFFNREAYRNLRLLIRDERPDVVYVLQQINALSPSIFKACADEGVRVVHRLSDFNMMCPRSDFLCDGEVCTACLGGDFSKARAMRCCHGSRITTEVRVASMRYHRARKLFDCVDAFICPTAFTASLLEKSGISPEKINVVPTFVPTYERPSDLRSVGESYALYLGRISPEKGVDLLVQAALDRPGIRLKVAGKVEDEYSRSVVEMVKSARASDRIEFVGFVGGEEKDTLIAGASCICCPSTWFENLPNAVLEAYAHGKPVVAFDIGCMSEIVEDGVMGAVVPLFDLDAFCRAVECYMSDPSYAQACGERVLCAASSKYNPEKHLSMLLEILDPSGLQGAK